MRPLGLTPKLVTSKPADGRISDGPASPLAWNAAYRGLYAVIAICGLWSAVGWALGWWGNPQ